MAGWKSEGLTAAQLSDGRIQLWATDNSGNIWSMWHLSFDWIYWQKPWTESLPPFTSQSLAVAPLSDKRLQFWAVDAAGTIWSCSKKTTDSDSPWTDWRSQWTVQAQPFKATMMAAAPLSDKRPQFWAVDDAGRIWSCSKTTTDSHSPWTDWTSQWTPEPPPFTASYVAAAPRADKRLQFWAVDAAGTIWSCQKSSTDPNASWTDWNSGWANQDTPFKAVSVAAAPLSDKRMQVWAVDTAGAIWSCWQKANFTELWSTWTQAWMPDTSTFVTRKLWAVQLSDGRLRVWVIDSQGELRTTFKTTIDSGSAWSNWNLAFSMMKQEETRWCWSATATATNHFYDAASAWTQCTLANAELGKTTCCEDRDPCNKDGYLNKALERVGNLVRMTSSSEPDETITQQVQMGQPLGVRIAWSGGGAAHFIMAVGGGPNDMVYVKDSLYGTSYITYDTMKNKYQGKGTWSHSYFTESQPES